MLYECENIQQHIDTFIIFLNKLYKKSHFMAIII
jgi:hypothetical protein